jgi:hypothetical protein
MSSEGFKNVPGVPDGWELVGFRRLMFGDWYVGATGKPERWQQVSSSVNVYAVIRKIEKPKQFRPFAGSAEAEPFFDERLRWKGAKPVESAIYRISVMDSDAVVVGNAEYSFQEMFELFIKADGTPFGVEVTE